MKEGIWIWESSGELVRVPGWGSNEPNGKTTENCLLMVASINFAWADVSCTNSYKFICQKDGTYLLNEKFKRAQRIRKLRLLTEMDKPF